MRTSTMKNGDVKALINVIDAIEVKPDLKLDVKIMYALAKNRGRLVSAEKPMEKVRLELVKKYGKKNKDGLTQVTPEKKEIFQKDWMELLNEEVEVEFHTIMATHLENSVDKLGGIAGLHLFFDYLIEDDTEGAEMSKNGETKKEDLKPVKKD